MMDLDRYLERVGLEGRVLRVMTRGTACLADVGFGAGTLLEPIPFGVGGPYEQAGWRFRLVEDDGEMVLQTESEGEWRDVYGFVPKPAPPIDIKVANWYTSSHPESRFVTGLIVSIQRPDGTRISLSDWNDLALVVRRPTASIVTPVERAAIPGLPQEHFGLDGFTLDSGGRVTGADRAST